MIWQLVITDDCDPPHTLTVPLMLHGHETIEKAVERFKYSLAAIAQKLGEHEGRMLIASERIDGRAGATREARAREIFADK